MAITQQTLRLTNRLRAELLRVTDGHQHDTISAWTRAWDEVATDLQTTIEKLLTDADGGRVSTTALLRNNRLRQQLAHIADMLDGLAHDNGVRVVGDLHALCEHAGAAQAAIIASQLPEQHRGDIDIDAWSKVDTRQLDAIVRRTTQQITSRHRALSPRAYSAVQRELVRGVAAGSNPRQTARRMVARAGERFDGGLGRALTIARTETLDAYRAASQLAQAPHADVLDGWEWGASMSKRTCPACLGMNGQTFPLSTPGPEGHQNCRCARLPVVKSWADLGYDVEEPPSVLPSTQDFLDSLSAREQRELLGSARFEAWQRGDFPVEKWATKRSTEGWRDSYVPARPPKSSGTRAA